MKACRLINIHAQIHTYVFMKLSEAILQNVYIHLYTFLKYILLNIYLNRYFRISLQMTYIFQH